MSSVTIADHPLVHHHLTCLRDSATSPVDFRRLISRLSGLLAYKATSDLTTSEISVLTPVEQAVGHQLDQRVAIVPILRAGLGMVDPFLDLLPDAEVFHLGMFRDEETAQPVEYYQKLPHGGPVDVAIVVDPMLATGGSATLAINKLLDWGVPRIKLCSMIAATAGIAAVEQQCPNTQIYVCAVDEVLNQQNFIVPGLGDAGDRIFNTLR